MRPGLTPISDKITVLVFKDNYASRTFQIPLSWISRFGVLAAGLILLALASTIAAVKYYRISAKTDPTRVQDLELELVELKSHLKRMESKETGIGVQAQAPAKPTPLPPSPQESPPSSASSTAQHSESNSTLFTAWPSHLNTQTPDPAGLPISIQTPKMSWSGNTLRVHFALQYTQEDQGSQQGRILILARGPGHLMTYPPQLLSPTGNDALINPERGEPFSVSRYREVKAEFGPVARSALHEIEILIFDRENRLLIRQELPAPQAKSGSSKIPERHAPASGDSTSSSDEGSASQ